MPAPAADRGSVPPHRPLPPPHLARRPQYQSGDRAFHRLSQPFHRSRHAAGDGRHHAGMPGRPARLAAKTYAEHFAASRFSNRDAIIAAYRGADPACAGRSTEPPTCSTRCVGRTRQLMLQHDRHTRSRGGRAPRPGAAAAPDRPDRGFDQRHPIDDAGRQGPQAAIDAMFGR